MACAPNVAHQFNLSCLQPPKDGGLSINTILTNGNGGGCGNTENSSTIISNGHLSVSKDKAVTSNGHANGGHKDKEVGINAHVEFLNMEKDVTSNGHAINGIVNQEKDVTSNGHVNCGHKDKEVGINAHVEFLNMEKDVISNGHGINGIVSQEKDVTSNGHVNGGYKDKEVGVNAHVEFLNMEKDVTSNGHGIVNQKDVSSKVLVIGATGFIGRFVAEASVKSGRITYALVRPTSAKKKLVQELSDFGVHILHGCLEDYNSLVKAVRQVDIVISTVGGPQILSQHKLIDAIKEVGSSVKRFLPSEFGHDVDHADPEEPALTFYKEKRKIRRSVEEAMIPYTYICCNSIAGWPYYYHTHPTEIPPPSDRFEIYGDGNVKAYFVAGEDIGAYTMQAVDDPRTLNKSLHFRPPLNFLTLNEMASIWEGKIQKTLPRVVITEEDLLVIAKANKMPSSIVAALTHDIFINGCQYKFSIQEPHDVEACELYPAINYTTIEDFFNQYL
ncbi:hypothetical protein SUGI_0487930 [Cryptomeria japonica]|uniref:isoflavone reductase homolog A622 n=1 Tax=Cryptomeria japonica TaxID=3369 RepID=UPI002408DA1E|nr:isoflavone reductase homolog A622 [Cryptomeria japonica]GLJ25485.1 hypothetical protein SUGI_0487930 [Cryptomeria japonica]